MEPTQVLVPKVIHESILDILEAQARKLAIDIAKTLNVDQKLLLQSLKKEKCEILTFEDNIDITDLSCKSYVLMKGVYIPCEDVVVYKKSYCLNHLEKHITFDKVSHYNRLSVLHYDNVKYYRNEDNIVYNSDFEIIGFYNSNSQTIEELVVET